MHFKPLVGNVWSVRIGDHYRGVAQKHGDLVVWFWIGTHEDYKVRQAVAVAAERLGQCFARASDFCREVCHP